ncbi:MAG: biotin/lipoate A/B protein ligase family protein [Nitrospiria bacterium]
MKGCIWRLLVDPPQSAAKNMAVDEAIAEGFSLGKVPSTLRFYRWSRPSFSIGAFQKLNSEWIQCMEPRDGGSGVPLVRRITGGRGLLHDHEMTYSVVSSTENPLFSSGIKGTYHHIAKGLLAGLQGLGIDAEICDFTQHEGRDVNRHPLCFSSNSWYEIAFHGKKLIGSAQRRWRTHFLQHGSLIIENSAAGSSLSQSSQISLISENQITLSDLLSVLPSYGDLIQALKEGFETALGIRLVAGEISAYEQNVISRLVREKYTDPRWNLNRKTKG